MKVIVTGATGMVGEAVLMECLNNETVSAVLIINRRTAGITHPKLKELLVPDFTKLDEFNEAIKGYDACFFCAGISSIGMSEEKYTYITYDTTIAFAKTLQQVNSNMVFCYVT
ncbi:MAG TPA: NAD-dependent epimerase/dehydratase family protein, partial [Chitinophagaceae bacterium]